MKKIFCFLLTAGLLFNFSMDIYAETLPQTPVAGAGAETETVKDPVQAEFMFVGTTSVPGDGEVKSVKEELDNEKKDSSFNTENKKNKLTELVEVSPNKQEEYNLDTFDEEDFEGEQSFSKMQLAKNIAMHMLEFFVYDLKSFVMFYPLIKTSSFITFCAWLFPLFFLYKKTGIDVPGMYSDFAMRHDNWHIFFRNLYNVIPMTLTSFMIKFGQEAYFKFKTA